MQARERPAEPELVQEAANAQMCAQGAELMFAQVQMMSVSAGLAWCGFADHCRQAVLGHFFHSSLPLGCLALLLAS